MTVNHHSPTFYQEEADFLKAMGHPLRLCILHFLSQRDTSNVQLMQKCMDTPQSTLSQHLAILKSTGLIAGHRKGVEMIYRIIDPRALKVLAVVKQPKP